MISIKKPLYTKIYKDIKILFDFLPEDYYIYSVSIKGHGLTKRSRQKLPNCQSLRLTTYKKNDIEILYKRAMMRFNLIKDMHTLEVFYLRKVRG